METIKSKKIIWFFLLFISILIVLSFIYFYVKQFWGCDLSFNSSDWGCFGDYFLLPVSILNLIVFFILTIEAATFQKKSFKIQILTQQIELKTNLREKSISEFKTFLDLVVPDSIPQAENEKEKLLYKIKKCNRDIEIYKHCKAELFDNFNNTNLEEIKNTLLNLIRFKEMNETDALSTFNNLSYQTAIFLKALSNYTYNDIKKVLQ